MATSQIVPLILDAKGPLNHELHMDQIERWLVQLSAGCICYGVASRF